MCCFVVVFVVVVALLQRQQQPQQPAGIHRHYATHCRRAAVTYSTNRAEALRSDACLARRVRCAVEGGWLILDDFVCTSERLACFACFACSPHKDNIGNLVFRRRRCCRWTRGGGGTAGRQRGGGSCKVCPCRFCSSMLPGTFEGSHLIWREEGLRHFRRLFLWRR